MKYCPRCDLDLPEDRFQYTPGTTSQAYCTDCRRDYLRERARTERERLDHWTVQGAGAAKDQDPRGVALHGIPKVALEDIHDLRQYIGGILARKWSSLPFEEQDELALEAIAIVYELHRDWRPADCPSFKALCTTYVPLRLVDHWRREMRRRTGYDKVTGGYENVVSLDSLTADALVPAEGRGRKKGIPTEEAA